MGFVVLVLRTSRVLPRTPAKLAILPASFYLCLGTGSPALAPQNRGSTAYIHVSVLTQTVRKCNKKCHFQLLETQAVSI